VLLGDAVGQANQALGAGEDGHLGFHSSQVEIDQRRSRGLFEQELARALGQGTQQRPFGRGELESVAVVALVGVLVGQEDLGRGLLQQGRGDFRVQGIGRALGAGDDDAVLLADRLELVADEALEVRVVEDLPELVDPEGEGGAVDQWLGAIEQIGRDRGAQVRVVQELGDIEGGEPAEL
jgi:hypothetical protein